MNLDHLLSVQIRQFSSICCRMIDHLVTSKALMIMFKMVQKTFNHL